MNLRFVSGLVLLLAGFYTLRADAPPPAKTADTPALKLETPWHTEEEWIVGSICRNAFEMLSFVPDKKGESIPPDHVSVKKIPGDPLTYQVTLHGDKVTVDTTLHFPGSIWSSQPYVPFCQDAMKQLGLSASPAGKISQGNPLSTLLDLSELSIEAENRDVSRWLTVEPDNAFAHQQAALILGTLALKENSGWFWDPRDACNHAIAHLAVARSLNPGGNLTVEGQLGECLVGLIADTKKECADDIERLAKIDPAPPELAAWLRAARMRNTRDWRILDNPGNASGLEQVEYVRALSEAVNPDHAIAWLRNNAVADRVDWGRIVMEMSFSVEAGHLFALPSLSREIKTMNATFPDRYQRESFLSDINEAPGDVLSISAGAPCLRVISGGMWARFFQRHLCHAMVETGDFLQAKWGVPEEADKFDSAMDKNFSGMALYPYVLGVNHILRKKWDDPQAILVAFTQHPEWGQSFIDELAPTDPTDVPGFHDIVRGWFSPPVPGGTAYAVGARIWNVGTDLKNQPEAIHQLYQIAPCQFTSAELELTARYSDHPTHAQVQEIMGPLVDYYASALDKAANASDTTPDERLELEQKAAGMDPERYWNLARDYLHSGRDGDAADAYQQWFDKGTDRVAVSNSMEWLVNYYYDHDQKDKAMTIARDCAETYSSMGLQTMMNLQIRMGQLDEAEDYGKKIQERYNESGPLIAFYKRQADGGDPAWKAKLDGILATNFPGGLRPVTVASFTGAPTFGIRFETTNAAMEANGITSSQVVVALDGYQAQNMAQYTTIRAFSKSPSMTFIVWDGQAYREIKVNQPGRRFGVELKNYTP